MGMSASQARLLTLTARIHDIEYQAQAIENAKVQLATQSDAADREYLAALDEQSLTISMINNGQTSNIAATFNNLFSTRSVTASDGSTYALFDKRGRLVVEDDVFKGYQKFKESSADKNGYQFALFMMGAELEGLEGKTRSVQESIYDENYEENEKLKGLHEKLLSLVQEADKNNTNIYDRGAIQKAVSEGSLDKEVLDNYERTLENYNKALYQRYPGEIYEGVNPNGDSAEDLNTTLFYKYVSIYKQIQSAGGNCISIKDFNGPEGDASNDGDWLRNNVLAGELSIATVKEDPNTGKTIFNGTSPSSDTSLSYQNTSSIDPTALKKAEVKHEKALRDIDRKEKAYDMTLSKLETERTALTTEYDSVKKVIEDNIERTFGIFS